MSHRFCLSSLFSKPTDNEEGGSFQCVKKACLEPPWRLRSKWRLRNPPPAAGEAEGKALSWTGKNLENKRMRDPLGWVHQANSRNILTSRMQEKSVQGKLVARVLRGCSQMEGCSVGVGRDGTHAGPQTQGAH